MSTASSTTERRSTLSPSRRWAWAGVWLIVGCAAFACGKTESEGASLNSGGAPGTPEPGGAGGESQSFGGTQTGGADRGGSNAAGRVFGGEAGSQAAGETSSIGGNEATAGSGTQGGEAGAEPADGGEAPGGAPNGGAANGGAANGGEAGGGEAGASGERVWTEGRAACGDLECDANLTQSGYSNCCYADASNRGCGTDTASGCTSFPATQLHCDSGGDCAGDGSEEPQRCVFSITNRLALCGAAVAPEGDRQLCEPGEVCVVGSCQPTSLDGLLPPEYWACLP